MKKRNFLKMIGLLSLSSLAAKSPTLKHKGVYTKSQTLHFKANNLFTSLELSLLSGNIELSHTRLEAGDIVIIPTHKVELKVIDRASFIIKEV